MAEFRKVVGANESDTAYQSQGVDTEFGDLDGAIAAAARRQFADTDPRRIDLPTDNDVEMPEGVDSWAEFGQNADTEDLGEMVITAPRISSGGAGRQAKGNPLDDYINYTYGLSLHIIPVSTYNSIAGGGTYNPGSNVLIASAGRSDSAGFSRRANFQEDFYFENLKFTTVIGYNSRNRGSNAIDVSFTIIEPYGITLLDRLLKVATEEDARNWNQMPFMLQIDFFGNNDNGVPVQIDGHTKYIPIKIIACNIKASTRGSEYRFSAVPYNHQAFHEIVGSSPAFLEVIAGTVDEFFKSDSSAAGEADAITNQKQYFVDEKQASRNRNRTDPRDQPESTTEYRDLDQLEKDANSVAFKVGSYAAALNSYQLQLKNAGHQEHADTYEFVIDSEIAKSLLVTPKTNNVRSTPMATNFNEKAKMAQGLRAKLGGAPVDVTLEKQSIAINAGTSIIDVINLALRNSKYISDQVNPKKSSQVGNKPIDFYKIIPEIKIGDFDNKRKIYQKTFKYHIKKFSYYNTRFPAAIRGVPQSWEKEYFYMFTGKNQSILDLNIEFDAMFYTAMTANSARFEKDETNATPPEDDSGGGNAASQNNKLAVLQVKYYANQTTVGTDTVGRNDVKTTASNDMYQSIMSNSRGDMINVKLKITGDPELIKQDDLYSDLGSSIPMDASEIFAKLSFRSASDIDDSTGRYNFDDYPNSEFSGLYKIIVVENSFERGQFTQTLDMIRLMEQSASGAANTTAESDREDMSGADSRSEAEFSATEESMQQMESGEIIPDSSSAALYDEDGTPSNRRIDTETGEAYNPVTDSPDDQDYFDRLKQIQDDINSATESQLGENTFFPG
jgi:hypothetical protein